MCNCVKEMEEKTLTLIKSKIEKNYSVSSYDRESGFVNKVVFFTETDMCPISMPFEVKYVKTKKDGTPESRNSVYKTNVMATYCPFCGVKSEKINHFK